MHLKFIVTLLLCTLCYSSVSSQGNVDILEQLINAAKGLLEEQLVETDDAADGTTTQDTTAPEVDKPIETQEPTEPEGSSPREQRLMTHLERVEKKMKDIQYFIAQEAAVDAALDSLDTQLNNDFPLVKNKVDRKSVSMEKELGVQLGDVKTTLDSVDNYARSRNKEVAGAIYYGGIGSVCQTGSSDCRLPDSGCWGRVCQCEPGLSYDALLQRCVRTCRYYGDTFQALPNYILRGFNTLVINETATMAECKAACREAEDFECRSLEFFPRWNRCYLSDEISSNETEDAWESNYAGCHLQRDCAYY